jgi:MbtH protein
VSEPQHSEPRYDGPHDTGPHDTGPRYTVVRNEEEQYSIWAVGRAVPDGWHEAGFVGSKQDCLAHVERVWTDLRPLSQRGS